MNMTMQRFLRRLTQLRAPAKRAAITFARTLATTVATLGPRNLTIAAALIAALLASALLARPYLHALRADRISVELGIRIAPSERAQLLDAQVLEGIESRALGRELKLRLDRPARRATLAPFLLDRCEVRQIDFERFAQSLQQPNAANAPRSISTGHRIAGLLHSPATGVDFPTAARYCAAAGGRLPWAEELEAAAAGKDGRLYAWGNHFDPGAWPYLDGWRNAARACASYPPSDSPEGIHDLNANAMEWSAGSLQAPPETRRPAAHGAPAVRARARGLYALNAAWLTIPPQTRSHHLGFRCAYDAPPPPRLAWSDRPTAVARMDGGDYPLGLPPDVRLARLALILPDEQLREARQLLALGERAAARVKVGRCEVSRREYRAFLNDPLARAGLFANPQQPAEETYVPADWQRQSRAPDLPVVGVSWWAADAFARWAGGRLPRAREWWLLAAGPDGATYPWGNRYDPSAAITADLAAQGPRACAAPGLRDISAAGARHLAGNVSEWTQSIAVERGNYAMWVQGGNWLLPGRATAHGGFGRLVPLNHRSAGIGFRVVYD